MRNLYKQVYKGIEFIRISKLPDHEKEVFLDWLSDGKIIKILCGDELMNDCVQYKEYEYWLNNTIKPEPKSEEAIVVEPILKPSLKHSH